MLRIKFILNNCIKRTEKVKSSLSGLPAKSIYANALALDKKIDKSKLVDFFGAPWRIRTVDTKRRRLVLYPAGLMVHLSVALQQRYYTILSF